MIYIIFILELIIVGVAFYFFYFVPKKDSVNKGDKFLKTGNFDEALLEYNKAIQKKPDNYEAHYKLANLYMQKNILVKAEEHLSRVVEIDKYSEKMNKLSILRDLGEAQFKITKHREALFTFKKLLDLSGKDYDSYQYMGLIYAGQLTYKEAIDYLIKAVKLKPNDVNSKINISLCYMQMDKTENAINILKEVLKSVPDNLNVKFYLGVILFQNRAFKETIEALFDVMKRSHEEEKKHYSFRLIAISYYYLNKIDKSLEILDTGIGFVKKSSMIERHKQLLYDYGMICLTKDRIETGKEKLMTLKTIDNYYEDIEELFGYVELKQIQKAEEEQETEREDELSPALVSYHRASQSAMGLEEETEIVKAENAFKNIKKSWLENIIPKNFLWRMGGLSSKKSIKLEVWDENEKLAEVPRETREVRSSMDVKGFMKLNGEEFQNISRKMVTKLGYTIINENFRPQMGDYVEGDGIDFVGKDTGKSDERTLIQIRRWRQERVGEIPLRNMTQEISTNNAKKGVFIVTSELTPGAQKFLETTPRIKVFGFSEFSRLLRKIG